ncbi:hypothetical protein EHYA_02925 [Embleya hyalina]|uniref:Uncharacterized protein n=1 Tax=Embleya hyalina TaxID=516124 RepID=A0A401YKX1_9ACTN|nr:hypothetical protein EHYA_02925 [Embleya hyalina]
MSGRVAGTQAVIYGRDHHCSLLRPLRRAACRRRARRLCAAPRTRAAALLRTVPTADDRTGDPARLDRQVRRTRSAHLDLTGTPHRPAPVAVLPLSGPIRRVPLDPPGTHRDPTGTRPDPIAVRPDPAGAPRPARHPSRPDRRTSRSHRCPTRPGWRTSRPARDPSRSHRCPTRPGRCASTRPAPVATRPAHVAVRPEPALVPPLSGPIRRVRLDPAGARRGPAGTRLGSIGSTAARRAHSDGGPGVQPARSSTCASASTTLGS